MASEVRKLIAEIERELAESQYQAAQWRGLSTALILQAQYEVDDEGNSPYYVSSSTLEEIKNWDIDAELEKDGDVVITLTQAGSGT